MDKVYLVYENSDTTEGRGPMMPTSGFFTDEDEAWAWADTRCGIMGRTPLTGSWRTEKYKDVEVRAIHKHDGEYYTKLAELKNKIEQLKNELAILEENK